MTDKQQFSLDGPARLKGSFHLAGLRMLAEMGLSGPHQSKALETIRQFDLTRKRAEKDHRENYDDRVMRAMKRMLHEAGQKDKLHRPHWAMHDRFDKDGLRVRAERRVRFAHQSTMDRIDRDETKALEAIARNADRSVDEITKARPQALTRERRLPSRPRLRD